ncbi:MAG TPA: translation initiation factor IF-3 [Planctomycetes bacterium]|nr:translation initiation factor IF-3 [Planctomycetota bacterium]
MLGARSSHRFHSGCRAAGPPFPIPPSHDSLRKKSSNQRRNAPSSKYRINRQIRVPEVRLIDEENEQVGVISTDDARRRADEAGLDLVEVQPNASPPVCRIMDYGKFKYAQKKKERGAAKTKAHSTLKELRVRPAIDPHDLEYRLVQGRKFLEEGHKVQVVCIFRGRQRAHPEMGYRVMEAVAKNLEDIAKIETRPKMNGPRMTMLLARK